MLRNWNKPVLNHSLISVNALTRYRVRMLLRDAPDSTQQWLNPLNLGLKTYRTAVVIYKTMI